jgi:hypothetical protein
MGHARALSSSKKAGVGDVEQSTFDGLCVRFSIWNVRVALGECCLTIFLLGKRFTRTFATGSEKEYGIGYMTCFIGLSGFLNDEMMNPLPASSTVNQ